jgi:nucleoside 2-deoxyribosyltransferase
MNRRFQVYLAGPISGLDYQSARFGWRKLLETKMALRYTAHCVDFLSPMRGKEFLDDSDILTFNGPASITKWSTVHPLGTPRSTMARDFADIRASDLIVAGLTHAETVSIGTMIEFGVALELRKPILLIMDRAGINPHSHGWVTEAATWHVEDIEDALPIIAAFCSQGL